MSEGPDQKKILLSAKNIGLGWRLGIEFTSGVVVGLAIGYVFDQYFDTAPWGMVVFIILGGAAGMLNVMRVVKDSGLLNGNGETGDKDD